MNAKEARAAYFIAADELESVRKATNEAMNEAARKASAAWRAWDEAERAEQKAKETRA